MHYNYLIIGQGIAGSVLAYQLLQRGKKVLVIDQPKDNTSSLSAGGIFNPITGRKLVKTWRADDLFPYLSVFYQEAEQQLGTTFLHPRTVYKPFFSIEEQNAWMGKSSQTDFAPYVKSVQNKNAYQQYVQDPYGGIELAQSGFLDVKTFLATIRGHLKTYEAYHEAFFQYDKLSTDAPITYENHSAEKVVFCDGPKAQTNPYFHWLPFRLVKGEMLEIKPKIDFQEIFNRGVFTFCDQDGRYKVGATYEWRELTMQTTDKARHSLVEKLGRLIRFPYDIVDQWAGIRPATKDRRPFIGLHPAIQNMYIFNGLGTKGVSLAPYFAHELVQVMEGDLPEVHQEANIKRYYADYTS